MAGMPSLVAGTFTRRLGLAMVSTHIRASSMVACVSVASTGETSTET
jgi:hypothetical protein